MSGIAISFLFWPFHPAKHDKYCLYGHAVYMGSKANIVLVINMVKQIFNKSSIVIANLIFMPFIIGYSWN